jgi:hypothetical protein
MSNNIDPYTGIRRKCFILWKNQFSLLIKCRNNTGIGMFLNNTVIVVYDSVTGEKKVAHKPNDSQNLIFETVEVIAHDSNKQRADLKKECLDFLKTRSWKESDKSVFRVNTPEGYEALNLESNGKNKYNIHLNQHPVDP